MLPAAAEVTGGRLLDAVAVEEQHAVGPVDDPVEVVDGTDRDARVVAGQEAELSAYSGGNHAMKERATMIVVLMIAIFVVWFAAFIGAVWYIATHRITRD